MSVEGAGDGGEVVLATAVTQGGELVGIALAGEEGADDAQASDADDVGDDEVELEVHLLQAFMDVLDVLSAGAEEHGALAEETPQQDDIGGRAEGAVEQAEGVELLDPLTVEDVGLAAGDMLHTAGVDEFDVESAFFEDLEEGDPVDASRLHGDGDNSAGREPVRQGVEVGGKGFELADVLAFWIGAGRHGGEVGVGADVDASGVGVDLRESGGLTHGVHLPIVG
jgi:hypothetical protein